MTRFQAEPLRQIFPALSKPLDRYIATVIRGQYVANKYAQAPVSLFFQIFLSGQNPHFRGTAVGAQAFSLTVFTCTGRTLFPCTLRMYFCKNVPATIFCLMRTLKSSCCHDGTYCVYERTLRHLPNCACKPSSKRSP